MNKVLTLIVVFALSLDASCQSEDKKVLASASVIADIARTIAGDKLEVGMIVPIGGDPHIYEPTPRDARLVSDADLILVNGLTFEGWINELIENSGTSGWTVTVTDGIEVLKSQTYKNSADPHAWMTSANGIVYAENIKNAFIQLDPVNTVTFETNFEAYKSELLLLDQYILDQISLIPEKQRVLITSHDAFQYYGRHYGIRLEAIMGISTEAEAQTSDVIRVNKVIREMNVPAVFVESTINPKLMEQLAADNNVAIGGKLYADSLGDSQSPASTYIKMLKHNTDTIVKALTQSLELVPESSNRKSTRYLLLFGVILIAGLGLVIKKFN